MIYYTILIISTLIATGKALICKIIGAENTTKKEKLLFNLKAFFVAFLCSLIFIISNLSQLFTISTFSFVLSIIFAISVTFTQIAQMKSMGNGPASTVTLIYSTAFLIPIIYSFIALNEDISIAQCLGVLLLAVALVLSVWKKEEKRELKRWLPAAILSMFGSGISAIIQKSHQNSVYSDEIYIFLVYCLFFSTIFTSVAYRFTKKTNEHENAHTNENRKLLIKFIMPLCFGVCIGILNYLNLMLSGKLPSVILFPTYNVGSLLLVSITSFVIYKERTTGVQKVGFCMGVVAILIIGLL